MLCYFCMKTEYIHSVNILIFNKSQSKTPPSFFIARPNLNLKTVQGNYPLYIVFRQFPLIYCFLILCDISRCSYLISVPLTHFMPVISFYTAYKDISKSLVLWGLSGCRKEKDTGGVNCLHNRYM